MPHLICPVCRLPLEPAVTRWHCAEGHSFDLAREGYLNLLLAHQKNSLAPGDNAESLHARRAFLQANHYGPLREAVVEVLAPLKARQLLDLGCGEGYYTQAMSSVAADIVGLDIAKPAIQLAARWCRGLTWVVASGASIPLADASVDVVCNLFTQLHVTEMLRVLAPGGHVLVVTPAWDHLWNVRERLFDEVRAHDPEKFLAGFESAFELRLQRRIAFELRLTPNSLRQLLLMTPYAWKARPEKRAALEESPPEASDASFVLMLFRKL